MKKYRCLYPCCSELVEKSGYCSKHIQVAKQNKTKPFENAKRSNDSLYKSYKWQKLRRELLNNSVGCYYCGRKKELQVHHIIPPRNNELLFFTEVNLITVCIYCHRLLTAKEIRDRKH
ncbi:MAG: HNH endonuclease [Clostridia bacterium]|nr:HNH endonuclease [Clostridia bacterium]